MSAIDAKNILQKLKISNKVILDPLWFRTLLIEASKQNKKIIDLIVILLHTLGKAKSIFKI